MVNWLPPGVPGFFWPATPPLPFSPLGISFDTSGPALLGFISVTDGSTVARFTPPAGALAPPTFDAPAPVYPAPAAPWGAVFPVLGLGHSPTALPDTFGWVYPAAFGCVAGLGCQTWTGNAAFTVSVVGLPLAPPVSFLVLELSTLPGPGY
ncbi:MAG: hypothetical protein AB1486_24995 [Planctomycetota bacterium]